MTDHPNFAPDQTLIIEYQDSVGEITQRPITIKSVEDTGHDIVLNAYCHLRKGPRTFVGKRISLAYTEDGEIIPHKAIIKRMKQQPNTRRKYGSDFKEHDDSTIPFAVTANNRPQKITQIFANATFTIWTLLYLGGMLFIGARAVGSYKSDSDNTLALYPLGAVAIIATLIHIYLWNANRKFQK